MQIRPNRPKHITEPILLGLIGVLEVARSLTPPAAAAPENREGSDLDARIDEAVKRPPHYQIRAGLNAMMRGLSAHAQIELLAMYRLGQARDGISTFDAHVERAAEEYGQHTFTLRLAHREDVLDALSHVGDRLFGKLRSA